MNNYCYNKISVAVPTYNQGDYIRDTLDSLLKQTIPPLEIVVCNNHSTDNTSEILKEYEDKIRIIEPETHLDMMENWNYLVSQLKGDWFALLSSDDHAYPNYVKVLVDGTTRSPNAILVRSGWENIDANGNFLEKRYLLSLAKLTKPPQTFIENLCGPKSSFAAFAVKKSAWEEVGGFPMECKLFGDWAFWLKLSPLGDFIYEHEIISGYRTAYRPGIELKRLLTEIKDEEIISTVIIPDTAIKTGYLNQIIIHKAQKIRFINRLNQICRLINDGSIEDNQRKFYAEELSKWAKSINCLNELNDFIAGKNFVAKGNPIKTFVRKIIHKIRS